jgi:hypothetical protein
MFVVFDRPNTYALGELNPFQKAVKKRLDIRNVMPSKPYLAVKVTEDNILDVARWAHETRDLDGDEEYCLTKHLDDGCFYLEGWDEEIFRRVNVGEWLIKEGESFCTVSDYYYQSRCDEVTNETEADNG